MPKKHPNLDPDKIRAAFGELEGMDRDFKVKITKGGDSDIVVVSRMYEYIPLNLQILIKLSKIFGTDKFITNQYKYPGCETCDFGSKYSHEFIIPKENR